MRDLDCIIIGYNEIDLQTEIGNRKMMARNSGAYNDIMSCVVHHRGNNRHYMDFLNSILTEASGHNPDFNIMTLPNLGACYLTSFLSRKKFHVAMVNLFNHEKKSLKALLRNGVKSVAITTTYYSDSQPIKEIVNFVRTHNCETRIIVGGPYIYNTCRPDMDITTQDYILDHIDADIYINDAQGEETLSKVLKELNRGTKQNLADIPNLIFKSSGGLHSERISQADSPEHLDTANGSEYVRTSRMKEKNSLNDNTIDWAIFPKSFYTPTVQMRTARGCSFSCAFCSLPVMAGPLCLTHLDVILKEMKQMHQAGVENLVIIDDTLNVPKSRFKKLLRRMITEQLNFNWYSNFRCGNADDETFDLMKKSGCKGVFLGLESGDQTILDNMNKRVQVSEMKSGIQKLNDRDIITYASIIVGFPGETQETLQNTINFIEDTGPTYYKAQLFYHSTRTPIGQQAHQYGLHSSRYSWRHNTMDWRQACDGVDLIYRSVKNAIILPVYMFDFWAIPYLFGKGIDPTDLKAFLSQTQVLLTSGLQTPAPTTQPNTAVLKNLLALGKKMSRDVDRCRPGSR